MGASNCEVCGLEGKTYYVDDKDWLCATCFKERKGKK